MSTQKQQHTQGDTQTIHVSELNLLGCANSYDSSIVICVYWLHWKQVSNIDTDRWVPIYFVK